MPLKPSIITPLGEKHPEIRVDEYKKIQPYQVTETEAFAHRHFTSDVKKNFEFIADNNLHHQYMEETINNPYIGSRSVNSSGGVCRDMGVSSLFGDSNSTNYMYQRFNREILPIDRAPGRVANHNPAYSGLPQPNIHMASVDDRSYNQEGLASQIANTISQLASNAPVSKSPSQNSFGPQVPGRAPSPMRMGATPDSMRQNRQGLFVPGAQFQPQAQGHRTTPVQDEQTVIDQIRRNREAIMNKIQTAGKPANKQASENDYEEI
jgi:hypothetical protein